jgi:hypothetical protein
MLVNSSQEAGGETGVQLYKRANSTGSDRVANFRRVLLGQPAGVSPFRIFCDVIRAIRRMDLSIEICVLYS